MNENNEYYEGHNYSHHDKHECFYHKHPFLSTLLTALSVLLGSFLAFYVVSDWHYKRILDPAYQMKRMEKMMMKEDRAMQKMMKHDFKTERAIEGYIQMDETPEEYIVSVNLRPFNNDEHNVSISTDDNVLTVHATNEKTKKNNSKVLAISQSYMFPTDVNFSKITKKHSGDKYLIIIPKG